MTSLVTKCIACTRNNYLDSKYCTYHHDAFLNLKQQYKIWVEAYGQISWQEYLNKLIVMNEVGVWVKEVIAVESNKS
jgi:hypothetical protein